MTATPLRVPEGTETRHSLYTGTSCLALIDVSVADAVWDDLLYDGTTHDHGAGGLMLNSASVGTHLDHDGDFPVAVIHDHAGDVVALRVDLDPYAHDLAGVREHAGSDGHGHDHGHGHGHGHDDRFPEGWSTVSTVRLHSDRAYLCDPSTLPCADDLGGWIEVHFPQGAGTLNATVRTEHGIRKELLLTWAQA